MLQATLPPESVKTPSIQAVILEAIVTVSEINCGIWALGITSSMKAELAISGKAAEVHGDVLLSR